MKLKDICSFQSGGTPSKSNPAYFNGSIPWITTVALNGQTITEEDAVEWITEQAISESAAKIVPAYSIMVGTRVGVGKTAINSVPMATSQDIISLIGIDESIWNKGYINKLIQSKSAFLNSQARGATIKGIKIEALANITINEISKEEQENIVLTLDSVQKIIAERQRELQLLDNLIKSRFVEMFGDPETNPFGWNKVGISSVTNGKASNGYFAKREEYVEEGNVAVLGVAYVVNRMYSQVEGLPRTNASESDIQKHRLKYGDMLFCRSSLVAEGIGKASIVPARVPDNTLFECHVIRIPLDLEKCVPEFMQVLSTTDYFRKQIISQSKTATMTTIGQDGILKTEIILPPIEKQRAFYSFVKRVDISKVAVQKALDQAQLLFDSLMQKYFE